MNININLTIHKGEVTDISILTGGLRETIIKAGLDAPATVNETIGILIEQLTKLAEEVE